MAKDRKKLQHIHSSVPDRQPTPATLEVGEIAVNGAKDQEFLSIKNTEDKVVRFSSDGQLIEWIERKEVMPYEGFTRGSEGPIGSTGPDSVTNDDLLQNKSNIIIKLNQVAADNTVKHDKVNGAKDIYNKPVNPTNDYGVSDGAGFAIDMSRYAMIDANPSFSSLTVTVQTDLSGNTTISDGAGTNEYGTDSGHTLTIKTTDVIATDTNWTETIANQNSTITTLNESATTRTTKIGTENLNVSGTTTIDRKGDVSENNQGNVTLVTSGATTETKEGNVTETNLANKVENTSGTSTENIASDKIVNISGETHITITGNTAIHTDNELGISAIDDIVESSEANITITANEDICETAGANASFYAVDKTNLGLNCDDSVSSTTTNLYGETINENASTANTTIETAITNINSASTTIGTATTTVGTADTNISSAKTVITTANTSATTADYSGNTLNAHVVNTTFSGNNVSITANTASTSSNSAYTNISTATTVINIANTSAATAALSGNTLTIEESTSISAKTPTTTLSGTNLTINETNTTISSCTKVDIITNELNIKQCENGGTAEMEFCGGYTLKSDDVKIQQCGTAGTIEIIEKDTTISGGTLTIRESGATDFSGATLTEAITGNTTVNVGGDLTEKVSGNTNITVSGTTTIKTEDETTIQTTSGNTNINTSGTTNITSTNNICLNSDKDADLYGKTGTNVGVACDGTKSSATTIVGTEFVNISGNTITESANTVNITGASLVNVSATTINEIADGSVNINGDYININSDSSTCISAGGYLHEGGESGTYIGTNCTDATPISPNTIITSTNNTNIESNKYVTVSSPSATCIASSTQTSVGAPTVKIGTDCAGTTIASGITINASTAVTINAPTTNITGDTYISGDTNIGGDLVIDIPCDTITSTTVNDALCEILERGEITMTTVTPAATSEILKTYKLWQNGEQIGEDINIPKDHLLKSAEIVYGKVNGDSFTACTAAASDCHWYIKLVWNVFDPSTGHADDKTTYMPADDFIKDIDDKNPNGVTADSYNNVAVNVWYDGEQNWVSATTTPTIHASQNVYADGTISGATVSGTTGKFTTLSAGATTISGATTINNTLTVTGNTTLAAVSATSVSATSVSSPTISGTNITAATKVTTKDLDATGNVNITGTTNISGSTKIDDKLTVTDVLDAQKGLSHKLSISFGTVGSISGNPYNGSGDTTVVIPNHSSAYTHYNLNIVHNGLNNTYDPASSAVTSMTMPHSALTIEYGVSVTGKSNDTYNTSAAKTVSVPTAVSHITRGKLKIQKNSVDIDTFDPSTDKTINITVPTSTDDVTNNLKYLKWTTGTPSADTTGYNGSTEKTITIPSKTSHLTNDLSSLTIETGITSVQSPYNGSAAKSIKIPASIDHLTNFDGNNTVTIGHDLKVSGTVTATGAIYSSDLSLKEHINPASYEKASIANNVPIKEFYFKSDPSRKVYGVIAQEVEAYGLGEVVVTGEDGFKGVDYTSLMLLKISYLENEIKSLRDKLEKLENKN